MAASIRCALCLIPWLLFVSAAPVAAQQEATCERPACLPGARWDGFHCRWERARPGGAGYTPTCGDSATLDRARGVCVTNQCARSPTIKTAPISGGTPGTVIPRAAPVVSATAGAVAPQGVAVDLSVDVLRDSSTLVECDGGIHASPVFQVDIRNLSSIATGGPVTVRAVDVRRPDVRGDTTVGPIGPRRLVASGWWKVTLPPGLRYGSDYVRDFDIIVDPDGRFADPDSRNNVARVRKIVIYCRRS